MIEKEGSYKMVVVKDIIDELSLEVLTEGEPDKEISVSDFNRPGLQFAGFYNYFASERIQIIGKAEWSYLECMNNKLREERLNKFFSIDNPCTIITRGMEPQIEVINAARNNKRWFLRTEMVSTKFTGKLTNYLDERFAPETRMHGVLVDVYGIGILITGESGVGKSETALELIKRGHRLIADDAVDIRQVDGVLEGRAPYITSGMMEVRGMGIIDVPALYGLSSVQSKKKVDLIVSLEPWDEKLDFDRLGVEDVFDEILNVPVKKVSIPIRPGRNIAIIIEAVAANYRYRLSSFATPIDIISKRMEEVGSGKVKEGSKEDYERKERKA